MDQMTFNIAVAIAGGFGGWLLKIIWEAIQDLKKTTAMLASELSDVKVLVAGGYVSRDSFEAAMTSQAAAQASSAAAMFNKLDRIEDKLDKKVDRP